ncbi:MAG: hydantoinase B/oxoprolinase family protein [Planctomycetes bacterium]|nr:hydantoinase B/oxoprolinase family protein [Planctomycetota bacterium]MBI3843854.1 hydantoinase B/oxoprolinase family protein [Planctomycetota bacterium]
MTTPATNAVRLEVIRNLFASVAEEMGVALVRTAFSPNIKERRDASCAVFTSDGELLAQAAHIPVHLGSMALAARAAMEVPDLAPGDAVLLNDPFRGGTHLPDLTLVTPVFVRAKRPALFWVANRAHHSDVGGLAPGSMAPATEIVQEGLRIPPVRLVRRGEIARDVLAIILANVRTPGEREGDLRAQWAANRLGERRLLELIARLGERDVVAGSRALLDYAERLVRALLTRLPRGRFPFEDELDDDGQGNGPLPIKVVLAVSRRELVVDFTGSAPQAAGSVNANPAIALSAILYAIRCLLPEDAPTNGGCLRPVRLIAPEGSIVNARWPAAMSAGNVETSQRLVDVILGALARALPDRIPAASAGTMHNTTIGGWDSRPGRSRAFSYYETVAGGSGATPRRDGTSGIQTHMTNTRNTPVEALESAYPLRVRRLALRDGSGGSGKHRGGDGVVRMIETLVPATVAVVADRQRSRPYGLEGGKPGKPGETLIVRRGRARRLAAKTNERVEPGDVIVVRTPGGGGHGR